MIIFNDTLGAYGGSHTLMLRMCTWLKQHNIRTGIFCDNRNNAEIAKELEVLGVEIFVVDIHKPKAVEKLLQQINEETKIISFAWNFYLDIERAKRVCNLEFENIIYCIHPSTFEKGSGFHNAFLRKMSVNKYSKIFDRMNKNHAIIMMDEIDLKRSEQYLTTKLIPEPLILRLPMECKEMEGAGRIISNGYSNKIIMTASRAEIPFKGYMLGLIDDFKVLKEKYSDLKLMIISDGEDINQVEQKISNLSEAIKKDVILHRWMDYDALRKLMEQCTVFIGMGTSVLDASLKYKPSIPVKFYTKENIADTILADNPINICAEEQCTSKAIKLLDTVLGLQVNEYAKLSYKSFTSVKEIYDIDMIMNAMVSYTSYDKKCILTAWEGFVHTLNNKFNRIRYRNAHHFDYRNIGKKQS